MKIREAKEEIVHTLQAYLQKDEDGQYCYPSVHQRPILLMGPPGIGKTAIVQQVAREQKVGLVAYTITHHTRQSAVGLPKIVEREHDGRQYAATEYTMSEIIDSVYSCIRKTGKREGILFIDEINCASETLAPTMLQFLQNKTFGSHRVPEGWLIAAAGNPPEYNKSVREFDIVTLDRIRRIDIEVDLKVWMEYAWAQDLHGAILSYLTIQKDHFYKIRIQKEEKHFVTARGWEDLSYLLKSYERLQLTAGKEVVLQYLQDEEIAASFAAYYRLYRKYGKDYAIEDLLRQRLSDSERRERLEMAARGGFEERFTLVGLILEYLNQVLRLQRRLEEETDFLYALLQQLFTDCKSEISYPQYLEQFLLEKEASLSQRVTAKLVTRAEQRKEREGYSWLKEELLHLKEDHIQDHNQGRMALQGAFTAWTKRRKEGSQEVSILLEQSFSLILEAFGEGQELVLLLSGLTRNEYAMEYISEHGCPAFFTYSHLLDYRGRARDLLRRTEEISAM